MAFNLDITPVRIDDTARDGKAQTCTARIPIAGLFAAIEPFKDMFQIFPTDAFTRIADGHFRAQFRPPYLNTDPTSR